MIFNIYLTTLQDCIILCTLIGIQLCVHIDILVIVCNILERVICLLVLVNLWVRWLLLVTASYFTHERDEFYLCCSPTLKKDKMIYHACYVWNRIYAFHQNASISVFWHALSIYISSISSDTHNRISLSKFTTKICNTNVTF